MQEINNEQSDDDSDELAVIENMNNSKWKLLYDAETIMASKVDPLLETTANSLGYDGETELPLCLLRSLQICTFIHLLLTILICFSRADFLNLSFGVVASLMLTNTRILKRYIFRLFTLILFLAFIYDIVWVIVMWKASEEGLEDHTK